MKFSLVFFSCLFAVSCLGQIPNGYYDDAEGLSGEQLREALHEIIDDHDSQSYGNLWSHFEFSDQKSNGKVWDMYSTQEDGTADYEFTFGSDQCGNYAAEGDCYNREHSVPASWYNDGYPMYTDMFHLYPTDGWTNGIRSAYPFGEVDNPSVTTSNGSKRGANTYPGYTGIVFEPIDEFKGDFARTYFYIVTRYKDVMGNWSSVAFEDDNLAEWQRNMLLEWHWNDPVSDKETNRNNTVYLVQENRNPFIDHPEWVDEIWESTSFITEELINVSIDVVRGEIQLSGTWELAEIYTITGLKVSSWSRDESDSFRIEKSGLYIIVVRRGESAIRRKVLLQ